MNNQHSNLTPSAATIHIKHYSYHPSDLLGKGNFSKVYRGINHSTSNNWPSLDEAVAIKVKDLSTLDKQILIELHRK